jgi:hypothetical protein
MIWELMKREPAWQVMPVVALIVTAQALFATGRPRRLFSDDDPVHSGYRRPRIPPSLHALPSNLAHRGEAIVFVADRVADGLHLAADLIGHRGNGGAEKRPKVG